MVSNENVAAALLALAVIVGCGHVAGHLAQRLRQPRLIGEIAAGVLLGPLALGRVAPGISAGIFGRSVPHDGTRTMLGLIYWLGLLLLMFVSGSEVRRVLARENRRATAWLFGVGTLAPFVITLSLGSAVSFHSFAGKAGSRPALLLVVAIAVTVMSIPVISRIFHELGILRTPFASLMLGVAVLDDIALWGVLAVATALAAGHGLASGADIAVHVFSTVAFTSVGLLLAPRIVTKLHTARWNVVFKESPVGYAVLLLLAYVSLATVFGVNLVFAAFLAGFGLVGGRAGSTRELFTAPLDAIGKVASGLFIPAYFVIVGSQLRFDRGFSLVILASFLLASSAIRLTSVGAAARLAGFRGLDVLNVSVTGNARGGPGIVLASVALDAGIINGRFFTTLVLTAILTSQAAGTWLSYVVRRGWPLLRAGPSVGHDEALASTRR